MTTSDHWQEIDRIFAAALELEPAERVNFLDKACAGQEQLRTEVESLLANDLPGSLMEGKAVQEATRLLKVEAGKLNSKRIGRYQIVRSLGSGGMGHVYLGLDEQLNRPVAVKMLSNYNAAEAERLRRFRQEALAASALNHPNILTIYEIVEFEGTNFITAEFVEGLTLRARMKEVALPIDQALDIATQIASALSAAHNSGIVHRDIKPENVMIRADGLVKVLDFGLAKFTEAEGDKINDLVETMPGTVIGTAAYMSPEQARGLAVDPRTDLWSLGVLLYEMVAHRSPFWGKTPADVMAAVIERQPPSLLSHNLQAPAELEQIVFKALQKEPDKRYQSAEDLLADLKQLRQKLENTGTRSESLQPQPQNGQPDRTAGGGPTAVSSAEYVVGRLRHHKVAALAILLTFVIAVLLAGVYFYSYKTNEKQIQSIAVLPFVNASGNADVEYLADGMAESLITSLSQLPELFVKARGSVFRYKGKDVSAQQVGKELNVQAILNGHVVQRGNDLILHIELVDAATERVLWSGDYTRSIANLVTLQSEIARDVSQKLRVKLSGAEVARVTKDYTANAEAYQLFLKGRFHLFKLTPPDVLKGISYLQQAVQLDPNYALAYVGLSEANRTLVIGAEMGSPELLLRAKEAAERAIKIDDSLAEAHTALGASIFWYDWNWNEVENHYKRALELNPNSADTHMSYAHLCSVMGRHDEALAEIKRARELDPYSPFLNALAGQFLTSAGKVDEALDRLHETYELAPDFWFPHLFVSGAYIDKGMFPEALAEARKARELSSAQTVSMAYEAYALAKLGKPDEARALLEQLLKLSRERFVSPYHIALVYNALGEREEAIRWLERGFEQRDPKMVFLKVDRKLDNLRGEPRFMELMRRLNFPE